MKLSSIDNLVSVTLRSIILTIFCGSLFYVIGENFEQAYLPVRTEQVIDNVEFDKAKGYLCWDYHSIKNRDKVALSMRVSLRDADGRYMLLSVFNRLTLAPWHLRTNVPVGPLVQPMCSFIPPGYHPVEPFKLDQTITYPGLFNLWNLTTSLPTVTYSALQDSAPTPLDKRIDNAN